MHNAFTDIHRQRTRLAAGIIALFLCFVFVEDTAFASRSTGITILDDKFQVVYVLNGRKAVAAFNAHWSNKQKVSASKIVPHWQYKIDLKDGTRWLYDPTGYTQVVSQKKSPIYRIRSTTQFNKLIGIHKRPPREGAGLRGDMRWPESS